MFLFLRPFKNKSSVSLSLKIPDPKECCFRGSDCKLCKQVPRWIKNKNKSKSRDFFYTPYVGKGRGTGGEGPKTTSPIGGPPYVALSPPGRQRRPKILIVTCKTHNVWCFLNFENFPPLFPPLFHLTKIFGTSPAGSIVAPPGWEPLYPSPLPPNPTPMYDVHIRVKSTIKKLP